VAKPLKIGASIEAFFISTANGGFIVRSHVDWILEISAQKRLPSWVNVR